jgi:hypothetical protein
MKFWISVLAAVAFAVPAVAQGVTPSEQVLGARLMQEINASLTCDTAKIVLQRNLDAITKERDELKADLAKLKPDTGK